MSRAELRVLVVGAGVAGLTLAATLERRGVDVVVVEREVQPGHGYMLGLYPIASRVLTALRADEALRARAVRIRHFNLIDSRGRTLVRADMPLVLEQHGDLLCTDRATLLSVLDASWTGTVQHGRFPVRIVQTSGEVVVHFNDDDSAAFDVVVGADGIGSAVRGLVWPGRAAGSMDTGWGGWVGFVPVESVEDSFVEQWLPGSFAGVYPVQGALGVVVAGPAELTKSAGMAEAVDRHLARTIDGRFHDVLTKLAKDGDGRWWPFRDVRAKYWARGRVVLVGDAAVGFLPTAGIGASMAMDSAARLADELARTRPEHVPGTLHFFANHQRPRVESVQRTSRQLAHLMFRRSPVLSRARDVVSGRLPERALTDPIVRPMRQWSA